jgi:hypothetical protein
MFREMLEREIEKVQKGLEPIGVYRGDRPMIDTKLEEALGAGQYGDRRRIWTLKNEDRRHPGRI